MTDAPAEPYVLSDKGLEEIRRRVTGTCECCGENVHDFDVADVLELLDDVDRLRGAAYAEAVEKCAAEMAERARIQSMEIRNGTFSLSLEDVQEMTAAYVATARTMLGDAENYSETRVDFPAGKVELELKLAGELDRYVFTVQRAGKLTPHEARVKAEGEQDAMRDLLASIWLYVGWRSATRSLTIEQRELWADAVDADVMAGQIEDGEEPRPVAERWWRDDFVEGRG